MAIDGYYRSPSIAGDTVVFVSEDDIWQVDRRGGPARRITSGWGSAIRPWISHDGQYLAYTGREEGDTEIYIMPAPGGAATRLTYWGANSVVAGFSPESEVIAATNYGNPFRSWFQLYGISPSGAGTPRLLPYGPAQSIAFGPHGGIVLGRYTSDPALWKRYRGGTAGQLWIDAQGTGHFIRYDGVDGNLASPMWLSQRIYFLSDHEGYGNLYSMTPNGSDLKRHTDHDTYYARNAKTDGHRIVYHAGADLFVFDPELSESTRIAVDYHSQRSQREPLYAESAKFVTEAAVNRDGSAVAVTTRGKLFVMGPWAGPTHQIGAPDGVRYRLSTWLPDDAGMVAVSDDGGEERLEIQYLDGDRPPVYYVGYDIGHPISLKVSPDGQFAALTNQRLELWIADLKAYTLKHVDTSPQSRITGLDWSPDSRWLAYGFPMSDRTSCIKLYNLSDNLSYEVTAPKFIDADPVFDPKGRYLYFLSYRTFNPVMDTLRFDYGFVKGGKPYVIPLQNTLTSPFLLQPKPLIESAKAHESTEPSDSPQPIEIDLDGIQNRILAFPVDEGQYMELAASADRVFWTTVEPEGRLSHDIFGSDPEGKATLHGFHLDTLKSEVVAEKVSNFGINADHTILTVRQGTRLRILKSDQKIDPKETKPGRDSGLVNLDRITLRIDRGAEWTQMLREAWRLMRHNFWSANMSGVDWQQVYQRYLALLPRVATRGELSDVMWEMQGELATSHAYEMGGDYAAEPRHRIGLLAADMVWDDKYHGYRITHIVSGDSFEKQGDSPLHSPGVNVHPGDLIRAVDGHPVSAEVPPQAWLIDKADEPVALTIQSSQDPSQSRTAVIVPLSQEMYARYREWTDKNRQYVKDASMGRVGYVHIPDMGAHGFSEFYRAYLAEVSHEALIIDIRYNGGGHVSPLLLQTLSRKRIGYDVPRWGQAAPYPAESPAGPVVALTNQNAGSDGDIFSHAFQLMHLGPLIGTRTWGGVIGIDVRYALVDGTITTQPEFSYWFVDVGWGVENHGVDPDIVVDNTPEDYVTGRDAQLHRAVQEVLKLLDEHPSGLPDFGPRPHLGAPPLRPRF
ncbi:MAG: S41 family peptidase [Sulfobacillus sp.]